MHQTGSKKPITRKTTLSQIGYYNNIININYTMLATTVIMYCIGNRI